MSNKPLTLFLSVREREQFLNEAWQKKHHFFNQAFLDFEDLVGPDDLAALAMQADVESRMVQGETLATSFGPFTEQQLTEFPESNATLLVQSVDHFDDSVAALFAQFDFIPAWRKDDVMISFSTKGGGVGAHYDHYDVFLVQGQGCRNWRIGQLCNEETTVDSSSGQNILQDFDESASYSMKAGDVLYIPPGVAHWGATVEDAITYSIGFRAPSLAELTTEWAELVAHGLSTHSRYYDTLPLSLSAKGKASARLPAHSVANLQTMFTTLASSPASIAAALGVLQTELRPSAEQSVEPLTDLVWHDVLQHLRVGGTLSYNDSCRTCYFIDESGSQLFYNGLIANTANCSVDWLETLCQPGQLDWHSVVKAGDHDSCLESEDPFNGNLRILMLLLTAGVWTFDIVEQADG
ncbi:MAG: cupin domain-containing protein [Pseudomonadales bacterium]